ncbi:terpenoid synthase [Punctularia strigosozonata HHB-11173 SS5]|uniref:terpenoid synthase n=1 Tax=Punctularia strigosozonata (strain HHB-11173) TaxID=741275 RepID=UPI00044172DB|nr:terpenoid synthase [Punctularia strigosozonata HHB-11173 SS5]EIN06376.1 terpenoid synthase [Punctularia strigosozonata HHB-11173 SS5]
MTTVLTTISNLIGTLLGGLSLVGGPALSYLDNTSDKGVGERLPTHEGAEIDKTRAIIKSFLQRCKIPYPHVVYDEEFDRLAREDAIRRGCPMSGPYNLAPFIPPSVSMSTTAYAHYPRKDTQVMTCIYTAFLIYLDDKFQGDIDDVRYFNERFVLGEKQREPTLECFAQLLREMPLHYGRVVSNIMVTSTLNLVTALLLEHETQGMPLRIGAFGYPTFSRVMSGASETYALFAFPSDLPLQTFIQCLPEMMVYINNGNDILSFYKEELAGETVNRVSFLAAVHGISKNESLKRLVDEGVAAHERVQQILEAHQPALDAYLAFSHGYIGFHAGAKRYRLTELDL